MDYQATTPMDSRVMDVMVESMGMFGNPHGGQHMYGVEAASAIERSRTDVADMINAYPHRIIFTSGATESCNLAIRGAVRAASGDRRRIVTISTEHKAVLETVRDLERDDFELIVLPVESDGTLDLEYLERFVDRKTLIVSAMAVNNEIGVVHPIQEIAEICHEFGALCHSDATQAPGRIEIDVDEWGVDMLTLSSHKIYGPKGIGALYISDDKFLSPIITGGGQERGFRSGTVPTPLVRCFGEAASIVSNQWHEDAERMRVLSRLFTGRLSEMLPALHWFGPVASRAPGTFNFGLPGISGDKLVAMVSPKIAISTGSSCASHGTAVSHVLSALGLPKSEISTCVRMSIGRHTTEEDVEIALAELQRVANLRG